MTQKESVEARLDRLEAINEIRGVIADYSHFYDVGWEGAGYDPDRVASLFTEDGVWDAGTARAEGRQAIGDTCAAMGLAAHMSVHIGMNPKIEVDGDTATGAWYGFIPIVKIVEGPHWIAGRYEARFRRTPEGWRIAHMQFLTAFYSPYQEGFGEMPAKTAA